MDNSVCIQVRIAAPADRIYHALTDSRALEAWFTEHADIALSEQQYDFWGRFTPGTPDRTQGKHPLTHVEPNQRLQYTWPLQATQTAVDIRLIPQEQETMVVMRHQHVADGNHHLAIYTYEDFWFLALENLRRYVDGKTAPVRCDFTDPMLGDVQHTVEIDAPAATVFDILIRPEQLNRWIASHARVTPVANGEYSYGWGEGVGPTKILEIEPNVKLVTLWPEGDQDTILTWTLAESGGKTRLTLVHSGFGPTQSTAGIHAGWWNFMNWVKSIAEYGADWQPPFRALTADTEAFYAGGIKNQQSDLIDG